MTSLLLIFLKLLLGILFWGLVLWLAYKLTLWLLASLLAVLLVLPAAAVCALFGWSPFKEEETGNERVEFETEDRDSPSPSPFSLLGVPSTATKAELGRAYRECMKKNHPDRVSDLDPEIQAFATERAKKITRAYEEALRGAG